MSARKLLRIEAEGHIALPEDLRRTLNLHEGDLIMVEPTTDGLMIHPVSRDAGRGSVWLADLYEYFGPVREEARIDGYTETEIDGAIDDAVRASRAVR